MDIDFTNLSLDSLVEDIVALGKSQNETRAIERNAEQEQMALLEATLKTNQQYAADQARLFSDTEVTLKEMQGTAGRISEISDSPLLRAIEPIAGFFSPEYSREKLHEHLQQQQIELSIKDAEGEMLRGRTAAQASELKTAAEKSKMKAAIARGDLVDSAQQLETKASALSAAEKAKALAIKQADSIDVLQDPEWQKKHNLLPGDVRAEIELRKDRKYTEQQQVYASRAARYQDQQRALESASREQLQDPKWMSANGIDPGRAEKQLQINDAQTMSLNNLRIASRQNAANDALDNMERTEIKKIASGEIRHPTISRVQADEHLKALEDKDDARNAARTLHKRQQQESQLASLNMFISTAPSDQLNKWAGEAQNGIATITDPDTGDIIGRVPLAQLQEEIKKKDAAMLTQSDMASEAQHAQDGLNATGDIMERALGLAKVEGLDTKERFKAITNDKNFPTSLRPDVNQALSDLDTALDDNQLPSVRSAAMSRANVIMQKTNEELIKQRTAHMTGARKAATVEFYNSTAGTVSREGAMDIALPSIAAGETTDVPGYNRAIQHWTNKLRSTDVRDGKLGNLDPQRQRDLLNSIITGKTRSTEDTLRLAGIDNTLKKVMGEEILADVGVETYATAAEKAGMPTLAARIRANDAALADENGAFSSANIMLAAAQELQRKGADPSTYTQAVVESIKPTIDRVLGTSGPRPELKASLNALVFDNEQQTILRSALMRDYNEAQVALQRRAMQEQWANTPGMYSNVNPTNMIRGVLGQDPIDFTQRPSVSNGGAFEMLDKMFK